jgi:hypothetical protein
MKAAKHVKPGLVRQVDVHHHHIGPLLGKQIQPFGGRLRRCHGRFRLREQDTEALQDQGIVINHQEKRHTTCSLECTGEW